MCNLGAALLTWHSKVRSLLAARTPRWKILTSISITLWQMPHFALFEHFCEDLNARGNLRGLRSNKRWRLISTKHMPVCGYHSNCPSIKNCNRSHHALQRQFPDTPLPRSCFPPQPHLGWLLSAGVWRLWRAAIDAAVEDNALVVVEIVLNLPPACGLVLPALQLGALALCVINWLDETF